MSLTSFVVCRSWVSNPLRTLLTLLGIALGVAIVVAIYVMDHNTIQTRFLLQSPERGPVDLEVLPVVGKSAAEVLADLRARPNIAAATVWREARGALRHGSETVDVQVFGLEPWNAGTFDHYAIAAGRDLTAADGDRAILVGAEAARILGVGAGSKIALEETARGVNYECRDGELVALPESDRPLLRAEVEIVGVLAPHRLGRRNFAQMAIGGHDLVRRIASPAPDLFQLQRVYGADLDRLRNELAGAGYVVADERAAQLGEGADERAFRNGLKVLGCLALLLGMFVVFQTLSNSLVTRVRLLGLLRCLGTGRGAVGRIFLGDALLLGVVGAGLGLGLGVGLAALLRNANISSLGGDKAWLVFELPLVPMLGTAVLGIVFTLAGAVFPLWRARQLPALWILRQRGLGSGGDDVDLLKGVNLWLFALLILVLPIAYLAMTPLVAEEGRETLWVLLEMGSMVAAVGGLLLIAPVVVALGGRLLLLPLSWFAPMATWLCRKSVQRQSGRIAASTVGLAAVLLAFLGLQSITASLRGDVHQFGAAALMGRAFVETPPRSVADIEAWSAVPGVAAIEPIVGEVHGPFLLRGLDVAHVGSKGSALEGHQGKLLRYTDPKVRTLIASRRLALKMGWREGSLVALRDRNQVPVSYEVLHISDASGYVPSEQAWAIASPDWLRRDFCMAGSIVQFTTLRLSKGADASVVGSRLRDREMKLVRYKTGDEILDYHLRDVDRDFHLFDLLLLLILLLAGTGLLNGMTIAALGRARELGVLRALGVGTRTLRGSLMLEGLVIGGLGAGLALVLAVPMAHVLIEGLNRVAALQAPVVLPVAWMIAVPAIGLLVGAAAAYVPARRAAMEDPAMSVRYE
jgi:putative ABC transport system permease protein